ncbi:MAG: MMPL family transporter [Candidatus Binatia bacterium]
MKRYAARAAFLLFLAMLVVFCGRRLDFSTDITNFMPDGRSADLALLARHLAGSDLARTMFLTVGVAPDAPGVSPDAAGVSPDTVHVDAEARAADEKKIARAVTALRDELAAHPGVEWLRSGPEESDLEQVWKLYFPHRFGFVSLDPEKDIPALATPEAIAAKARAARESLASPTAALTKRMLPADPLGFAASMLERLSEDSPSLKVHEGIFFSRDGFGVLILVTTASAFDASRQAPLLEHIEASFAAIRNREGGGLVLEKSGANRFAVAAEGAMKRDMWWIAGSSLLGIAFLVVVYFRSATRFAVAMLPSVTGILVAAALGIVVFGDLDGLTIAFGVSLLGVAIDYPVHFLNHLAVVGGSRRETVRLLAPSLGMGALTTVASFAGMAVTSFPGFREIGFFAAVGVAAALVTTLVVVPLFVDDVAEASPTGRTADILEAALRWSLGHRRLLAAVPVLVVCLGFVMLPHLQWQNDLSKLGNMDPALESEEKRVQGRAAPFEAGRVVLVMADSEQEALQRSEEVARRLEALQEAGSIGGYRSAANLVRSVDLQQRNRAALAAVPDLAGRVRAGFADAGFRPSSFDDFARDLAAAPPAPLLPEQVRSTALGRLLDPLLPNLDGRSATITQVSDPRNEAALRREVDAVPGAHYFVQRDFVNDLYAGFRDSTLEQLLLGGVLVIAVLALRYRRWRPTVAAFLPSALVPVLVLSGLAMAGESVNLLHVLSLLMVTGMGVDYGIFLVDNAGNPAHLRSTLVGVLLCCLTTVFGFAVVAVSEHPALRAMGITIGSGVMLALLLSPVSLLVMGTSVAPAAVREEP